MGKNLELRLVNKSDCDFLYKWRNHFSARVSSRFTKRINYEEHKNWFYDSLKNPKREIYVGLDGELRFGQIRFDKEDEEAEVSITIAPEMQGKGYGSFLIKEGSEKYMRDNSEIKIIRAEIKPKNISSIKAFEKSGYKKIEEKDTPYGKFQVFKIFRE